MTPLFYIGLSFIVWLSAVMFVLYRYICTLETLYTDCLQCGATIPKTYNDCRKCAFKTLEESNVRLLEESNEIHNKTTKPL